MITSELRTFEYPGGEIQRVQAVRAERWQDLSFVRPRMTLEAFAALCEVYRDQVVARVPWVFGELVLFHVPEDVELPFAVEGIADKSIAARLYFRKHYGDGPSRALVEALRKRGYFATVRGKRPFARSFLPFAEAIGFLSREAGRPFAQGGPGDREAGALLSQGSPGDGMAGSRALANASFFTFDLLDASSPYDIFGTPLGLLVKDGAVEDPPLFGREALLVERGGKVCVRTVKLAELKIRYLSAAAEIPLEGTLWERPARRVTPRSRNAVDVVIIGQRIAAVRRGGGTVIPCSGFVIQRKTAEADRSPDPSEENVMENAEISVGSDKNVRILPHPGDRVLYRGMEDFTFGIQVGNSLIRDGVKTSAFLSPFYDLFRLERVPYPPSLYPLDFEKARAPRMALGADAQGRPVLLWAEGAPKIGYTPGRDSCGASLREMADIAEAFGLQNAVNLDGGGSAQILVNGERRLQLSGRRPADGSQVERPVPLGIMMR